MPLFLVSLLIVTFQCRKPGFDPWVRKIPWRVGIATCSSILAWRTPWTEEPGRLQSRGSQSRTQLSDFTFTFPSCCHSPLNYMDALRVGVMPWKEFQHATHSSHPYHITGFGLEPSSYLFLIVDIIWEIPLSSASQPNAW